MIPARGATVLVGITASVLAGCKPVSTPAWNSPRPTDPRTAVPPPLPVRPSGPSIKVYGGTRVTDGALMAVVGLTRPGAWTPSCTCTLIAPDVVLSAAHCFCAVSPSTGDAYVGDDASRSGGRYYKIVEVRLTTTCAQSPRAGLDLAVVRLIGPVRQAKPVAMAPLDFADRARQFRVVGFGAVDLDATVYTWDKREAAVQPLSPACRGQQAGQSDATAYGCHPGTEIVAGQRLSPDSCAGDSGGPLLVAADGSAGERSAANLLLIGVTSRSVDRAPRACGYGGIYERLTADARARVAEQIAKLRR